MIHLWHVFQHWLAVHTGTVNESGPFYGFWSGFGSDLGEVALVGGLVHLARSNTCHQKGCWRIAKHPVGDGTIKVCTKHHPAFEGNVVTAEHVQAAHAKKAKR